MSKVNNYHFVFVFYKNGTYKIHKLSTSRNKLAAKKRSNVLDFLAYDETIKKFHVITGADNSPIFRLKLNRKLNSKLLNTV